jgi:predicted HTH transcriptional regulator
MINKAVQYIKKLIGEGEHQQLDFKFEISDSRKIAKTLVAFANTDGGTLLIGVKDNGNIAGVRSEEEYYMVDAAATMYCKPRVPFETRKWDVDGKIVLEVIIARSPAPPHYAQIEPKKWMAYVRVKDENILANSVLLKVWKRKQQKVGILLEFSEKEKLLLKHLETNPSITLSKFCKLGMISRYAAENILANLITLGLLTMVYSNQGFVYQGKGKNKKTPEPSRLSGFM